MSIEGIKIITVEGVQEGTLNDDDSITVHTPLPWRGSLLLRVVCCIGKINTHERCLVCNETLLSTQELPIEMRLESTDWIVAIGQLCDRCGELSPFNLRTMFDRKGICTNMPVITPDIGMRQAASMAQQSYEQRVRRGEEP